MKLENEFSVAASLQDTWATLLDIERVATCLPGARIEPGDEDGVYRGAIKMKLGPMTVDYQGTARLQEADEDTHTASIAVQAREARGQGTAAAVISNRLESLNGKTKVVAITDLQITGRQAQFGRAIMEDVAKSTMEQFAERLEQEIARGSRSRTDEAASGPEGEPVLPPQANADPLREPLGTTASEDVLDVGNVLAGSQTLRYAGIAGGVLLVLVALVFLFAKRRNAYVLTINLKR